MRRISCAAVLLACVLMTAAAAPSSGSPRAQQAAVQYTIRTNQGAVARIGSFRPARDAKIAAAIRVFGQPSSRHLTRYNACIVKWRRIGLRITFASYAVGPGADICSPSVGLAQSFAARGSRFRTWASLRPGM